VGRAVTCSPTVRDELRRRAVARAYHSAGPRHPIRSRVAPSEAAPRGRWARLRVPPGSAWGRIPPVHSDRHRPARHRSRRARPRPRPVPARREQRTGGPRFRHQHASMSAPQLPVGVAAFLLATPTVVGLTGSTGSTGGALGVGTSSGRILVGVGRAVGPFRIDTGLVGRPRLGGVQLPRHRGHHDARLKQQPTFEPQRRLIVQQVLPPVSDTYSG